MYCDNSTVINAFPVFDGADSSFICKTIPYIVLASVWIASNTRTFQSPETIILAILAGGRFVNPAWVTEYSSAFVVASVQCNEGMIDLNRWKLGICTIS
jgi:hypothetical protein